MKLSGLAECSSTIVVDGTIYPCSECSHVGVDPRNAGPGTALAPADDPHQLVGPTQVPGERATTVSLAPVLTFLPPGTEHQIGDLVVETFPPEHRLTLSSLNRPVTVQWSWDGHIYDLW